MTYAVSILGHRSAGDDPLSSMFGAGSSVLGVGSQYISSEHAADAQNYTAAQRATLAQRQANQRVNETEAQAFLRVATARLAAEAETARQEALARQQEALRTTQQPITSSPPVTSPPVSKGGVSAGGVVVTAAVIGGLGFAAWKFWHRKGRK